MERKPILRFTKIRCLLLLSVGGLCFPAYSSADGAVTRVKNQTLPPGTAATPFIIDRSPMATSADAQLAGFVAAQGAISDYTVEPGGPPLLARIGMAGRQNAAQAGILNAETLTNSINKFQQAFLMPGTVSDTEANGLVKQFFQFAHNAFYDQNTFDKGILGTLFTKSLGRLSPYTTIGKQRAQALPNVPAVNPAAEAEIVRTEKARFDAVSTYLLEQFAKFAYPLQNDVLAIEEQSRWLDKQNDFTTRLTYSNAGLRTDVIGQYQTGTNNGYGAGLRFALDAYKLPPEPIALIPRAHPAPAPPALPKGKAISPVIINDLQADTFTAGAGETFRQASRRAVTGVPLALGTYILRPHFGLAANFQHFNGAGNYYDAGANVSALLPSRIGNRPSAFFYGAGHCVISGSRRKRAQGRIYRRSGKFPVAGRARESAAVWFLRFRTTRPILTTMEPRISDAGICGRAWNTRRKTR